MRCSFPIFSFEICYCFGSLVFWADCVVFFVLVIWFENVVLQLEV